MLLLVLQQSTVMVKVIRTLSLFTRSLLCFFFEVAIKINIILTIEEVPVIEVICWNTENDGLDPSKSRPQPPSSTSGARFRAQAK